MKNSKVIAAILTAGRQQLGEFSTDFARYNDDILFGEVWSKNDILSLHDRSIVADGIHKDTYYRKKSFLSCLPGSHIIIAVRKSDLKEGIYDVKFGKSKRVSG